MKLFSHSHGQSRSSTASRHTGEGEGQSISMERFTAGDSMSELSSHSQSNGHRESQVRKYKSGIHQISTMTFNNQDTVLMRAETLVHVCFLHDNRIYIFNKMPAAGDENDFIVKNPNYPETSIEEGARPGELLHVESLMRELILHMVTSPKYRLLNSMYIVFSSIDHFIFISIVVTTIVGFASVEADDISSATFYSIPLTGFIMLEIFFGILLNTTHFWILRRVSVYIVCLFYLMYYGAIAILGKKAGSSSNHINFLYMLLAIRFVAFVLETFVDVSIDLSIHNDIILINKPLDATKQKKYGWGSLRNYLDVRHCMTVFDRVPSNKCYVGSLCSWLPISIQYTTEGFLKEHITNSQTTFGFWTTYAGCAIQIVVSLFFATMLGIIVFIAVMAVVFVGLTTDIMFGRKHKGGFTNFVREIVYHF
jgi:hypothetical protein